MDRGGVSLLAGGPLDCLEFSIFPSNRRDQAYSLTGAILVSNVPGLAWG